MNSILHKPTPVPLSKGRIRQANYFRYFSPKYGDYLECESELEYRHIIWRESDPNVRSLCTQPIHIEENVYGKHLNTILDAWTVQNETQEIYWEVKPQSKLIEQTDGSCAPKKWSLIQQWAKHNSVKVCFITEAEIDSHKQQIDNCLRWLPYLGPAGLMPDENLQVAILDHFRRFPDAIALEHLFRAFRWHSNQDVLTAVLACYQKGDILTDLGEQPFGLNTLIWERFYEH